MTICGALNELNNLLKADDIPIYYKPSIKAVMDTIILSSSENPNKWIPVSERLPEEDGEYLLFGKIEKDEENYIFIGDYDSCGEKFGIWQDQYDRSTLGWVGSEFYEYASVIAWMPLPEAYKTESEE